MPHDKTTQSDNVLGTLKNEVEKLKKEILLIKSQQHSVINDKIKIEMGVFDSEEQWDLIDDPEEDEDYFYYTIPVKFKGFSKIPKVFLSLTGLYNVDFVYIYADKISHKGFKIILRSYNDLSENRKWDRQELVINWLAIGN